MKESKRKDIVRDGFSIRCNIPWASTACWALGSAQIVPAPSRHQSDKGEGRHGAWGPHRGHFIGNQERGAQQLRAAPYFIKWMCPVLHQSNRDSSHRGQRRWSAEALWWLLRIPDRRPAPAMRLPAAPGTCMCSPQHGPRPREHGAVSIRPLQREHLRTTHPYAALK